MAHDGAGGHAAMWDDTVAGRDDGAWRGAPACGGAGRPGARWGRPLPTTKGREEDKGRREEGAFEEQCDFFKKNVSSLKFCGKIVQETIFFICRVQIFFKNLFDLFFINKFYEIVVRNT
ncbi:hypothetical protein GUJ93_ZPchr0014g46895 [Zizania palustris]|uniref:Uncharacterized protein n=1 Tax=Zizania palustris TaxID=103762 RepID=A0A8J5TAA9_ZIZPA|nr:hypothetical protein GUJ93_ZPchr0014g46895 [Zizania palustris]